MTAPAGNADPATGLSLSRWGPLVAVGVALDQATKWWAETALADRAPVSILPTLEFDLHYNNGFSFGTGQGAGRLIGLVVIAMSLYLVHLIRSQTSAPRAAILAVILSGAIGNLIDRIFRAEDGWLSGNVVDFIDVSWFAIFNVADIFVVGGVILFLAYELLTGSGPGERGQEPPGHGGVAIDPQTVQRGPTEDEPQ